METLCLFTPVTDNPKSRVLHFMKHDSLLYFAVSSSEIIFCIRLFLFFEFILRCLISEALRGLFVCLWVCLQSGVASRCLSLPLAAGRVLAAAACRNVI